MIDYTGSLAAAASLTNLNTEKQFDLVAGTTEIHMFFTF